MACNKPAGWGSSAAATLAGKRQAGGGLASWRTACCGKWDQTAAAPHPHPLPPQAQRPWGPALTASTPSGPSTMVCTTAPSVRSAAIRAAPGTTW